MIKVFLSSDHGGYDLKEQVKDFLLKKGNFEVVDLGTNNGCDSVSYVDFGNKLASSILENKNSYGIGICGTGIGISIAVNRHKGIRGARVTSVDDAYLAKRHNNANILLLGGRQLSINQAIEIIDKFFETEFEGGRHINRINSLDE